MRFSVWGEPRVISWSENYPDHIALRRGCLDAVRELLRENDIACKVLDVRFAGEALDVMFDGMLRLDQEMAVAVMLHHDEACYARQRPSASP